MINLLNYLWGLYLLNLYVLFIYDAYQLSSFYKI